MESLSSLLDLGRELGRGLPRKSTIGRGRRRAPGARRKERCQRQNRQLLHTPEAPATVPPGRSCHRVCGCDDQDAVAGRSSQMSVTSRSDIVGRSCSKRRTRDKPQHVEGISDLVTLCRTARRRPSRRRTGPDASTSRRTRPNRVRSRYRSTSCCLARWLAGWR